MSKLDKISASEDVKKLSFNEKTELCSEISDFIIDTVSKNGGHLASNLGVVELTVALHTVFDIPRDKFVWDVGHQSYVNKLLTGRREGFKTLRKLGGMSGFPKTSESEADVFNTGHSSTSISAALGIARARDLSGESFFVGAIFGDGSLTGGMMYEAMNDAGISKTPLILILNDNHMSISKNVGSVSKYLRALRLNPRYSHTKSVVERFLDRVPYIGGSAKRGIRRFKRRLRSVILPNNIFENMGFEYFGPVDGHDLKKLIEVLTLAKNAKKPVFVHVSTKKGKGYQPAENYPERFHGLGPFDKETGEVLQSKRDYSSVFGDKLFDIALENEDVVGITCAMPLGTGMSRFSKYFRDRFFDVGIAEQHGVTMAAGLAAGGRIPVIPVYSSFLQRAYDQILHDVCLQNLHVVFGVDRAGIVGADGETHQGIYDIAYLSSMPNMAILSPSTFSELEEMLSYAVNEHNGPIAIRYPRGSAQSSGRMPAFEFGRAHRLFTGNAVTVYATGRMVAAAQEVRRILGEDTCVVAVPTVRPLDRKTILETASPISCVIEDGICSEGLGSAIAEVFARENVDAKLLLFGFPDSPVPAGTIGELDRKYGVDAQSIAEAVRRLKG